jgi:hypothetical protein
MKLIPFDRLSRSSAKDKPPSTMPGELATSSDVKYHWVDGVFDVLGELGRAGDGAAFRDDGSGGDVLEL